MPSVTELLDLPGSGSPTCTVTVELVGTGGYPMGEGYYSAGDTTIVGVLKPTVTAGAWSATLVANSLISPSGSVYKRTVKGAGFGSSVLFQVPDGAGPYVLEDIVTDAPGALDASGLAVHQAAADPHSQYLLETAAATTYVPLVSNRQSAELDMFEVLSADYFTAGNEPWQIAGGSFANDGAGAGTYNHAMFVGFNAGRHAADEQTVDNKPTILMGFEDNYYDSAGDLAYGTEWYVEGWSPDGTTVQMSRPFYARGRQADDGTNWWTILHNIGTGSFAQWQVRTAAGNPILGVVPTAITAYKPVTIQGNLTVQPSSGQAVLNINSPVAPTLRFDHTGTAAAYLQAASTTSFRLLDKDARTHATFTQGASGTTAVTALSSTLTVEGSASAPDVKATGKTGATATPLILAGGTTSGAPTSGAHLLGEVIIDATGAIYICTTAGTPGTWVQANMPDLGIGPHSFNPNLLVANIALDAVNRAFAFRSVPGPRFTMSKIGLYIGTSSGNLDVGVVRASSVGKVAPTTRIASSGSTASPGTGYREIALTGSVEFDPRTDYLTVAADNTTITFGRGPAAFGIENAAGAGFMYAQSTAFPIPSTPSMTASVRFPLFLIGVA